MHRTRQGSINIEVGGDRPRLLIVCDAPSKINWEAGICMAPKHREMVLTMLGSAAAEGVVYISPCEPIPEVMKDDEKAKGLHLARSAEDFIQAVARFSPDVAVTLGKTALRQVAGRAVKITNERGSFHTYERTGETPVMPVQSPANIFTVPQLRPIMESDLRQVIAFAENGWAMPDALGEQTLEYEWVTDLEQWLDDPPEAVTLDTETKGLIWFKRKAVLAVQLCAEPGKAIMVPFNREYFNDPALRGETTRHLPTLTGTRLQKLQKQMKQFLTRREMRVCGHNLKFDLHHLRQYGIENVNWVHDTMQLAFTVDENMQSKSLDECVRRWVPALAGYADTFNADPVHQGKSRMDLVPHDKMLRYGCGDVDACIRLAPVLIAEAKKDMRNYNVYERVKMPALKHLFLRHAERFGLPVDKEVLTEVCADLTTRATALHSELLQEAAEKWPAVCRYHASKGLKFSRPDFIRDLLFAQDGMGLTPVVATKKTRQLAEEDQLESTSKKDHLPYFEHIPWVAKLMEHQTLATLVKSFAGRESQAEWVRLSPTASGEWSKVIKDVFAAAQRLLPPKGPARYRGPVPEAPEPGTEFCTPKGVTLGVNGSNIYKLEEEDAKGFWWYLENVDPDAIHPSFGLHTAVTGRSNCREPNLQNIPKRGAEAKNFRRMFKARPGWVLVEVDLSQAELRVAACMARERKMIEVYANDGDIHTTTAQSVMGIYGERWNALPSEKKKELRQMAKAVNFGYLYGMWWKKFKQYAKTSYGVVVTDRQAERSREAFFLAYPGLVKWHDDMKAFANKHKYVRALHGALRRLPSLDSVEEGARREAERQAVNSPVQGFASDLGLIGGTMFAEGADTDVERMLGFIHDAGVAEAREGHEEITAARLKWCMENQPLKEWFGLSLPVPIVADASIGRALHAMEERPGIAGIRPPWC